MHRLAFCEPSTCPSEDFEDIFEVNEQMYDLILKGPEIIRDAADPGYTGGKVGYVFGPLFPKESYKLLGFHGNDVAQTGIFEINRYNKKKDYNCIIDNIYDYDWNDRKMLTQLRKVAPEILWLGETFGGDVGASYYVHIDANDQIDSLVVSIYWIE